ncbi:MAG: hypothetical protein ACTSPI_04810, partial [Candidatus Heimdallarchaeaceae archaeon]
DVDFSEFKILHEEFYEFIGNVSHSFNLIGWGSDSFDFSKISFITKLDLVVTLDQLHSFNFHPLEYINELTIYITDKLEKNVPISFKNLSGIRIKKVLIWSHEYNQKYSIHFINLDKCQIHELKFIYSDII